MEKLVFIGGVAFDPDEVESIYKSASGAYVSMKKGPTIFADGVTVKDIEQAIIRHYLQQSENKGTET